VQVGIRPFDPELAKVGLTLELVAVRAAGDDDGGGRAV